MKKFLSMLLMAAGLMSCGDDDKPFIPELNKLTSVTCTKNGNAFFNANITYDQDKVSVSAMLPLFFKQEYLALSSKKDESRNSFPPYSRSLQGTFA